MNGKEQSEQPRVLLVDDEDDFRATLAKRLSRRNLQILDASRGEEALRIMNENQVDVVVLDVKMPGMGGTETLCRIKERYPNCEVIMLTGHATAGDGVEGIKSGAFDYLFKPVEIEHLYGKIRQAHDKIKRVAAEKKEAEFRERMKEQMVVTERLAALGTLATGVAHEINNPLAIIRESAGWMQQLLAKPEMSNIPRKTDFEKAIDKIHSAVERARRITRQLLEVVKTQDAELAEVDLRELIGESIELVKKTASNKNIQFSVEYGSVTFIWTDPYRLRQVLLNLLTNAIHATDFGGWISVSLRVSENHIQIFIQDSGCGIPRENLAKIFEPFFSTKGAGQGTGMGLYVSRGIIEKLGGTLTVESRVGKGSKFIISLPLRP
jgi:two-component system, NtrC family, sensor kinase